MRQVARGQLVLVAEEVVVVHRERSSAQDPAVARLEPSDELRIRGVECRLVTKGGHGRRAVVVLVVVVLGFEAELRGHGPEPGGDPDPVDFLGIVAGARGRGRTDVGVRLLDSTVPERRVDEMVGKRGGRQLPEVFVDVQVGVGQPVRLSCQVEVIEPVLLRRAIEIPGAVKEQAVRENRAAHAGAGTDLVELTRQVGILRLRGKTRRRVLHASLAMEAVRARLGHPVDDEAAGPAVFGGDSRAGDVDLRDVELREILKEVGEERVRHVHAVVEKLVVLPAAARVEPRIRVGDRDAAVRDARSELHRPGERASEWEFLDRGAVGDVRNRGGLRVDQGNGGGHFHRGGGRGAQRGAHLAVLLQRDDDRLLEGAQSRKLRADAVFTRDQPEELKAPVGGRRDRAPERQLGSDDGHGDARHGISFGIPDGPRDRPGRLRERERRSEADDHRDREEQTEAHRTLLLPMRGT